MSITLRPYQEKIIHETREALKQVKGVLIRSPTGSGKTAINSFMTKSAAEKGNNIWFVVHREELLKQSSKAFLKVGVQHGFVAAGFDPDYQQRVQICSIFTLVNRLHKLPPPKVIVYDECQYMSASTWDKVFNTYPDAFHIGLSATPYRLDGKGFKKYFQKMVNGPEVKWLIDNKYLSDYKVFAPTKFDASKLKTKMGDYDLKQVDEVMNKSQIIGDCFDVWKKHAFNLKTIIFAPSVSFSQNITARFNAEGIVAKHLDAETPKPERDQAIKDYGDGKITVLSNVRLFTEGFDVPSIQCVMLTRPTKSLSLYLQMVGRGLRREDGKTHAIILDQVNSCYEHGLPDDEREWSLDDREKKKKSKSTEDDTPVKICQKCFAANHAVVRVCSNCGEVFAIKLRPGPEQVDGELHEIDKLRFKKEKKKEQGSAKSLDDLIAIGVKNGYKNPRFWAMKVYNGRKNKK